MEDVRNHWEKITFSYSILSDVKKRARFDRNSALDDPGAAMGRMAVNTVGWGLSSIGNILFTLGKRAYDHVKQENDKLSRDVELDKMNA